VRRRSKHGPIGLDIGASGIKLVQFSDEGPEPVLLAAARAELTNLPDDLEARRAALRDLLAEALRRHPFQGRRAVTALGSGEFQMKSIRLPRMPSAEMESAIAFEAQDRFGVSEGAQFRHLVAGEVRHGNELKEEVIVFAAGDADVSARLNLLESLKLQPLAIDIAPCAVARSFFRFMRRAEDADAVNVFLDVGWRGTSVVLTHGTRVRFLKLIDVGGKHFVEAVAKALSITPLEAAELRIRLMHEASSQRATDAASVPADVRATAADAVRPVVERVARDVQLCLRYFAVTFRGQRPQSLTLVGGEAHEPGLLPAIAESVDVPCSIGNPLRGVGRGQAVGLREQRSYQPAWAVACGLALLDTRWLHGRESSAGGVAGLEKAGV
jgi:type IV pilus assembly protein PilM